MSVSRRLISEIKNSQFFVIETKFVHDFLNIVNVDKKNYSFRPKSELQIEKGLISAY